MALTDLYRRLFGYDHLQDGTVIDLSEHGKAGGVSTGQGYKHIQFTPLTMRFSSNASVSFYGFANPGTNASLPNWRIMRQNHAGTFIDFPNGSTEFEFIWDERALLEYS